ncbi:MAG: sugar transferase [Planctomycetaceae bacterium]|nr:sugar transferase [Planctomycetaceae bacterium]
MLKRLFDLFISGFVLLLLAVPFAIIAIILRLSGEGEVWYLQDRVGRHGRIFKVYKFATMLKDSPNLGSGDITIRNDPRVLPLGGFLRKTKINELPQFINVFLGQMSLVGWRPLMPVSFQVYAPEIRKKIVEVKPGITGIGSVIFRDEESIVTAAKEDGRDLRETYRNHIMPYKGALELWYTERANLWTDIKILLATTLAVLRPDWNGFRQWFDNLPQPQTDFMRKHFASVDAGIVSSSGEQSNALSGAHEGAVRPDKNLIVRNGNHKSPGRA